MEGEWYKENEERNYLYFVSMGAPELPGEQRCDLRTDKKVTPMLLLE